MQLCTSDPLPSFDSIYKKALPYMTFPPVGFQFPKLPTINTPLFSTLRIPHIELTAICAELQSFQIMNTMMSIIKPILKLLGLAISSFLPKVTGLAINLLDLLTMDAAALYAAVKNMISDLVLPFVPVPIYLNLSIPDLELKNKVTTLVKGYLIGLLKTITDVIGKVVDFIKNVMKISISSLPQMPNFPTMKEIKDKMFGGGKFSFPGFPEISLPDPLIPTFASMEIYFIEKLNVFYNEMILAPLKIIVDFCKNVLSKVINFTFPTFCITI